MALCFSPALGGLELATLRRGAELQERGHRVTVVLPDAPSLIQRAREMGLAVEVLSPKVKYLDVLAAWRLRQIIKRDGTDVILAARSHDLSTALLAARNDVAVVLYRQMQSGLRKRGPVHNWIYRRLDGCITITRHGRDEMIACTAIDPAKLTVVPYGIDSERFSPHSIDRDEARSHFALPSDAFVVGIIGGFTEAKGQREFVRALGIAAEQEPELGRSIHGLMVGENPLHDRAYVAEVRALRDALPFADRVSIHPFLPDPRVAFAALDMFVLASYSETFGMVVQEAIAMGVPTIATASEGVREIISDGETGLLVPARDADAIARAIVHLYRDPQLRGQLIESGRNYVREAYDETRQYEKFERALMDAVERRQATSRVMSGAKRIGRR